MSMNPLSSIPRPPIRAIYALGMALITIIAVAFYGFYYLVVYEEIVTIATQMDIDLGTNSTRSDSVVVFFDNTARYYIPIFSVVVVALWAYVYSQKKGVQVYEV